jgi:hypothetical protein
MKVIKEGSEMPELEGLTPDLAEAWGNAWSYDGRPPGKYIGSIKRGNITFYYYKNGQDYYYENDYDIEMRHKKKLKNRYEKKEGTK